MFTINLNLAGKYNRITFQAQTRNYA